jgi:hypothetical protein
MDDDIKKMREEVIAYSKRMLNESNIEFDNEKLDIFKSHIKDLLIIKRAYEDKLPNLRAKAEKEIVKFEFSKGGELIHRGYYCPSPIFEYIVGNVKRGRLLKRKPDFGKFTYEYGFDKEGNLIRVRGVNEFTKPTSRYDEEYLIYKGNVVYGLEFDTLGELSVVSKCNYENGNIVKYERCVCSIEEFADLNYEEYKYEGNCLTEVVLFFNIRPEIGIYEEGKYIVEQDDNGKIVKLTAF